VSLNIYSKEDKIDLVAFPETSFTGYMFKSSEDAMDMSVFEGEGEEFEFCSSLAKRLQCYVAFGYIEKEQKGE